MPAWPGGNCPDCGDFMPPNLITCQTCRALLNNDLTPSFVDIPEFVPLREINLENSTTAAAAPTATQTQTAEAAPQPAVATFCRGFFASCPGCSETLKIPFPYWNHKVQCNFCSTPFRMGMNSSPSLEFDIYAQCPHCQQRIQTDRENLGQDIPCSHCQGTIQIQWS